MKYLYYKLIVLFLFGFLLSSTAFGQYRRYRHHGKMDHKIRIGLKGGFNVTGMKYVSQNSNGGNSLKSKPVVSFQAGVVADLPATRWMSLQSGLIVSGKGANIKQKEENERFTYKMHPRYLEVPLSLIFSPKINYSSSFYFGAGPYAAFAIGGKGSYSGSVSPNDYYSDHRLKFGNGGNKDMRMMDLGMKVLAGIEFNRSLMLGAQYGWSFRNLSPKHNSDAPDVIKNRDFNLTLTILFGRRSIGYY